MPNRIVVVRDLVHAWRAYRGEPVEGASFREEEGRWIGMIVIDSSAAISLDLEDVDDGDEAEAAQERAKVAARATRDVIFAMSEAEFMEHVFMLHVEFEFLFPFLP